MATNNPVTAEDIAQQTLIYQKTGQLLIASIGSAVDSFDKYQKPLLGLGLSLDSVPASIKQAAMDIPVGLNDAMGTITESFQAGLFAVDKSTLTLAGRMKATGENSMLLFKSIRSLNAVMGENTENLSTSLRETSDSFHISTTSLINVLTSLESVFEKTRTLADAEGLQKLVLDFTGEVGASQEKQINRFFNSLLDPSIKSLTQATLLGLEDFRNSALTDPGSVTSKDLMALMPQAVQRMEDFIGDSILMQDESATIFGDMGLSLGSLQNSLKSMSAAQKESLALNKDFGTSWNAFKGEFLKPLLDIGVKSMNFIMKGFNSLGKYLTSLIALVTIAVGYRKAEFLSKGVSKAGGVAFMGLGKRFFAPILAALVPLAGILMPIIAIASAVTLLYGIGKLIRGDKQKEADEAALTSQKSIADIKSRFSETLKDELSGVLSFIQLNSSSQLDALTNINEAIHLTGNENAAATRESKSFITRAMLEGATGQ
jgi:hypothetical protein